MKGVVLDAISGEPIEAVSVLVDWPDCIRGCAIPVTSDAEGKFSWAGLTPEPTTEIVRFEKLGYQTKEVDVREIAQRTEAVLIFRSEVELAPVKSNMR